MNLMASTGEREVPGGNSIESKTQEHISKTTYTHILHIHSSASTHGPVGNRNAFFLQIAHTFKVQS